MPQQMMGGMPQQTNHMMGGMPMGGMPMGGPQMMMGGMPNSSNMMGGMPIGGMPMGGMMHQQQPNNQFGSIQQAPQKEDPFAQFGMNSFR
jgi:hypothetical protein